MKFKALVSFSGILSMKKNEVREIENKIIYKDLLQAGYVEEVKEDKVKGRKKVNADES